MREALVHPLPWPAAVTPVAPLGAGSPDPLDLDAAEQLQRNEHDRLRLVRARAEKWIGAIAALTAVLGSALIIKGPDDATKLNLTWRIAAAAALGAAIVLLAFATYRAYRAAFGQPDALQQLTPIPMTGLHQRLTQARRAAADSALSDLAAAIRAAFAAVALIAGAVAITWFSPTPSTPPGSLCIYADDHLIARLDAAAISVKDISANTTIKSCP